MLQNIILTIWHLPMVWDIIAPLAITALFCAVLYWEGEHGHVNNQIPGAL